MWQGRGKGKKKSWNSCDVIYGWPLGHLINHSLFPLCSHHIKCILDKLCFIQGVIKVHRPTRICHFCQNDILFLAWTHAIALMTASCFAIPGSVGNMASCCDHLTYGMTQCSFCFATKPELSVCKPSRTVGPPSSLWNGIPLDDRKLYTTTKS